MPFPRITVDRLERIIKQEELVYEVDPNDGEVGLGFQDIAVWFNITEDLVRAYAFWRGELSTAEDVQNAFFVANTLNGKLITPKVLVHSDEEQQHAKFIFEHTVLNQPGFSDEQLLAYFRTELSTFTRAAEECAQAFPNLVTWSTEPTEEK